MREAEQRLAEAAQQIAELSSQQLPRVAEITKQYRFDDRPKLGITIGDDDAGPTKGVSVMGVSPGGAADDAGLHSGDTITAINGESLAAESAGAANGKLLDFMSGVEAGDVLKIEYLRKGKAGTVELAPKAMTGHMFAFGGPGFEFAVPVAPGAPVHPVQRWEWISGSGGFGDMELVTLTERLGKYFGTDKGLLVVRAPEDDSLKLEDGDVIQRIDGREPTSVSHAMRIFGSYQSGEKFEIEIMRDKKRQKLSVDMPDNRQSRAAAAPRTAPVPATAPAAPVPEIPPKPDDKT
jgi:S1-C subfamily serine protease